MIQCPKCISYFNETCMPVQIACSHVYCITCVKELANNFQNDTFNCPACGIPTTNLTTEAECKPFQPILDLVLERNEIKSLKPTECSECDQMCTTTCSECPCHLPLCENCFKLMHQTSKRLSHTLGPYNPIYTCEEHQKPIELICLACFVPICQFCVIIGSHKDHIATLPSSFRCHMEKIPSLLSTLESQYAATCQQFLDSQCKLMEAKKHLIKMREASECSDPILFLRKYKDLIPFELRILMLGLDGSGKTSMLYRTIVGETTTTLPTIGFNVETLVHKNIKCTIWDVGGHEKIRPLWRHYFPSVDALIFMINCNDTERIYEARDELINIVDHEELIGAPFLILANARDSFAMDVNQLDKVLQLSMYEGLNYKILPVCSKTGAGFIQGLDWLALQGLRKPRAYSNSNYFDIQKNICYDSDDIDDYL